MTYTITREQLADALAKWEDDAEREGFPTRTDGDRHLDAADYLLGIITEPSALR